MGVIANDKSAEPYVIAADVYAGPLHNGRGGWTWYTGSAGWMYQLVLEYFIGLKREGNTLYFKPCIPEAWTSVKILYTHMDIVYAVELVQEKINDVSVIKLVLNGEPCNGMSVTLKAPELTPKDTLMVN